MAKKAVASLQTGKSASYSKVIKMVKSPKTGAYIFDEQMVPSEKVQEFLKKEFQLQLHKQALQHPRCGAALFRQ